MSSATNLPPKKDVARALLLRGSVFVHLDPRGDSVSVPQWLRRQPQLVLQVGLDMAVPIPDLKIDDEGICGTLSFNRAPFYCQVKWDSIFALAGDDGRGMVWPESMPDEIRAEVDREAGRRPPPAPSGDDEPVAEVVDLAARRSARPPRLREVPRAPATPVGMDGKPLSFEPDSMTPDPIPASVATDSVATDSVPDSVATDSVPDSVATDSVPDPVASMAESDELPTVARGGLRSADSVEREPSEAAPVGAAAKGEPDRDPDDPDPDDRPSSSESKRGIRTLPPYLRVVK